MYSRARLCFSAGTFIVIGPALYATDACAGTQPVAGNYAVTSYIVSASAGCLIPKGTYLSAVYSYPGPGKTGASARTFINGPGGNLIEVFNFLPATPAAGAATWSGNYVQTFLPGGAPVTGTFSFTIQYVDSRSFVDTGTYTVVVQGVTCTTVVQEGKVLVKP